MMIYSQKIVLMIDTDYDNVKEDAQNYFMKCSEYDLFKQTLPRNIISIKNNISVTLPLFLKGSYALSLKNKYAPL